MEHVVWIVAGLSLLPLLFLLYVCDLHQRPITNCPNAGVTVFQLHYLAAMYAGDLILLRNGQRDVGLMEALIRYAEANNLTINFHKSELLPLMMKSIVYLPGCSSGGAQCKVFGGPCFYAWL